MPRGSGARGLKASLQYGIVKGAEATLNPMPDDRTAGIARRTVDRALYELWRWQVRVDRDPKLPDLRRLLQPERQAWDQARRAAAGPVVLFSSSVGRSPLLPFEAMLAIALTLRGARVHFVLCDRVLPACENMSADGDPWGTPAAFASHGPDRRNVCWSCYEPARRFLTDLGLPLWIFGDAFDTATGGNEDACLGRLALEEHAVAGAIRYYRRSQLPDEAAGHSVLKRYRAAATLSGRAALRLLDRVGPDVVVSHHGMYVPQGVWADACRVKNVRVATWGLGSRRDTFIFSHDDTFLKTMASEPCDAWSQMPWTSGHRAAIVRYLDSRRTGARDWRAFVNLPIVDDASRIAATLGIDRTRPLFCLLTNVCWDAQVRFTATAFPNQLEWIRCTLNWFANRPDLQLVVRVHPAEVHESLQRITGEIHQMKAELPNNITLIPPESHISTLALAEMCNAALIYGTTAGTELAALRCHTIVAGEAWCRNKGFTIDASSPDEYLKALETLPLPAPLSADRHDRAMRYAYHFFFRRLIDVRTGWRPTGLAQTLGCMERGHDSGLDVICDGILQGTPFVHDDPALVPHL